MRHMIFILLMAILSFCLSAETIVPAGNISGVWNATGSPYRIMGNVTIQAQDMLVLEAGTFVLFEGTYQMQVLGKIFSNGTANEVVTFTATDTLNGWSSIRFNNNSALPEPHSGFSYTHFLYGRAVHGPTGLDPLNFGGAVWANNAGDLFFENCLFSRCKSAQDGSAIYAQENSNVMLSNCTISNCESGFFGGVFVKNSNANIENCTFKNNYAQTFGAALYFYQCPLAEVTSSIIADNVAGAVTGIYSFNSVLKVKNSLLKGNDTTIGMGGGIGVIYGALEVTNCTFEGNTSPQDGGAIWLNGLDATAPLTNNIFWNNLPFAISATSSTYNLSYCSLQAPEGDATNISGDPLFTNPAEGNYTIASDSPCVDAGTPDATGLDLPPTDLAGNDRIVDGNNDSVARIDIGCYERPGQPSYGNIIGNVYDDENEPLEGALVAVGSLEETTDEDGFYEFVLLPGFYSVTCSMAGYIPVTVDDIQVIAWQIAHQDFILNPVSNDDQYINPAPVSASCSPNPFRQITTIHFNLEKAEQVNLNIYNLKGQKVRSLLSGNIKAGSHSATWNGTDDQGNSVSKGIYIYRLECEHQVLQNKLMKL